eukprot:m.20989 g.20989  ORF g.20989 m.20989 type:complete len:129 (-) comp12280_c0_seq1:774-1160(-)
MAGRQQRGGPPTQGKICQFKLVLLGESAVGKSSLVLRFVKGQFHEYQESTIGAAFLTQTVCLDDTTVKFEIWDTAGQVCAYICESSVRTNDYVFEKLHTYRVKRRCMCSFGSTDLQSFVEMSSTVQTW